MLRILDAAAGVLVDGSVSEWIDEDLHTGETRPMPRSIPRFVPKSSDNYTVELEARSLVKSRRHEAVVNDLQRVESQLGWRATSEHPIDLVLRRSVSGAQMTSIVEVKTVLGGMAVDAVRAAIGQLFTYRYQLFEAPERSTVGLVAAFSEDIGVNLQALLSAELGIAVLWLDGHQWRGCKLADERGLVPDAAECFSDARRPSNCQIRQQKQQPKR